MTALSILSACLQLPDTDQASSFRTLQLFAYGTWATYQGAVPLLPGTCQSFFPYCEIFCIGAQDRYLPLSTAQQLKLRQLTLVTMAAASKVDLQLFSCGSDGISLIGTAHCQVETILPMTVLLLTQNITYSELIAQLGINSIRELEDLIITECFYKGIVSGKLDQQKRCLQVITMYVFVGMYSASFHRGEPYDHCVGCSGNRVAGARCAKRSAAGSASRIAAVVGAAQCKSLLLLCLHQNLLPHTLHTCGQMTPYMQS